MSNQFYKYLSNKVVEYFESNEVKAGERYYIQLDEKDQVEKFYNELSQSENVNKFSYRHKLGSEYSTFSISLKDDVKVVVASTINVTPAYLVTIRNASQEQQNEWENTALLIICNEPNDSIKNGCRDMKTEGMPLNVKYISNNLNNEMEKSQLSKIDKEIVKFHINNKLSDVYNASLWDYEEVLSIINKNSLDKSDYKEIGLFPDKALDTYSKSNVKSIQKRLKENNNLYSKVEGYQEYEDKEQQLEKLFDSKGVEKLKKENWRETDYVAVKQSFEDNLKNKPLGYEENMNKTISEGVVYWEKAKVDTASGKRKRHIIVFNNGKLDSIKLKFKFTETLYTEYIQLKSKEFVTVSGKTMTVTLPADKYDSSFYRLVYEHKKQAKSKYEFNVAVVNIEEDYLKSIKTIYEIKTGSGNKNRIQINSDGSEIKFGTCNNLKEVNVDNSDDILEVTENSSVRISNMSSAWDDDSLRVILKSDKGIVPLEIKEQNFRSRPIHSINLMNRKRERCEGFTWEKNKIKQGTDEFYLEEKLKETFIKEKSIIDNKILYGVLEIDEIAKKELKLSTELTNAYLNIIEYYTRKNNIPSLTYIDEELRNLYEEYLNIFNKEIEEIQSKDIIANDELKRDLLKIGTIKSDDKIMFTPLSPINITYSLEVNKQLSNDNVETHILERLTPNSLLPYIYGDKNKLYKPIYQKVNMEWLIYEKEETVSVGETNAFVAKVVKEKLNQFINNFSYLFPKGYRAPIKINIINIKNDREVVRGVFDFIKNQINSDSENIIPIEINVYNGKGISEFDRFFDINSIEKLQEEFDISFKSKNNQFDEIDIMRMALQNIRYYKHNDINYKYAHISFYKTGASEEAAEDNASSLEAGVSLGGLLSTVTSNNNNNDYRIGFGTRNLVDNKNELIRTAINLNELAVNCYNGGINPYRKDTSIVTRPLTLAEEVKEKLFNSSNWVTFIEPSFGLEYFEEDNNDELVVIHYSDQYTSTDQYDTITVTNKSEQYKYIIKEFLSKKNIENVNEEKLNEIIKSFNSINGEWLLNLIANKSEFDREKLSIISALKYGLSILNHEDIIWVPISLEEIIRVSSAVKLNKSEGIFSLKNLKEKGMHSDDLIFIGVNIKDEDNLKVYYYPVEVKVGYNFATVVNKGSKQLANTYELLRNQLTQYKINDRKVFKNKFFRNFFIKLFITNAQKLCVNNIWNDKEFNRITRLKKLLLNDEYNVSFELEDIIGKGALISFKKDNTWRSIRKDEDILYIELTEDDAYYGVAEGITELDMRLGNGELDIPTNDLLRNKNLEGLKETEWIQDSEIDEEVNDDCIDEINSENEVIDSSPEEKVDNDLDMEKCLDRDLEPIDTKPIIEKNNENKNYKNDMRILLGEAEGSTKKIYWEYGNKGLANRHMLITGKSGNGKTYFIQCALKELVDNGVPAIIIDYTDGFKSSQLEPEFKEYIGDRLKQFIVARDKFPLNPFKKGQKELDEDIFIDEDSVDVAERFKSVIGAVYKELGVQQLNSIYQAVQNGLDRYDGKLNLRTFRNELEEDKSSYAQTALSQLNVLLDKNPFEESKEFQWDDLHKDGGKIFIIQLTGYTKDVQRIITEMILWDLWNYKTQHGSKDKPFAVILDEAQNLNFGDNSPSTKILTEGRKFGWSAWFSTQFLKGQMDKATISRLQNSAQKIYFAQTEEEASVVANGFANSSEERKIWTKKLINLEKGNCISYGPIRDDSGEMILAKPIKISISSLNDRIKK